MDFWQDTLLTWSVILVIGFPLLIVLLTEAIDRLERRQHPLAHSLRQVRNIVLPVLAVLLVIWYILDYDETALLTRLVATLFWVTVVVVAFRLLKHVLAPSEAQPGWYSNVPGLLLQLPRFLLALLIGYYLLSGVWNVNVGELITALGIGSLVIALALQDTLNNLFAGLLLSLNRPFQVGDWVQMGDIEGQVVEVNWRASLLRTRDNDLVVIPNGEMAQSSFKNYSRPTKLHRVSEGFDLHIDNLPNKVHHVFKEAALATPRVLADPAPEVRTISYAGISVHYDVFFWIADYGPVANIRNEFMTRAYYHAKRHGLKWPTPQHELFYYDGPAVDAAQAVTAKKLSELLKTLPSFAVLADEAIEVLAGAAELLDYGQNEQIVCEGEKERGIYVLTRGRVSISSVDSDGQEHEITQMSVGDFFGETGLFGRAISSVTVTALEDVEVLLIPHRAMNNVINKYPRFAQEMSHLIGERRNLIRHAQRSGASLLPVRSRDGKATMA
jgi:small-conductance mechanosensitive channel/CRP-like cAMP-binding protein